jgi:hypothetical protein
MSLANVFESRELTAITGMTPNFLNRLVERGLHGIKPSVRSDVSTGGRRWFSQEDVYGVALVYWLFEAGLRAGSGKARTSVIQNVLDEIVGRRGATANEAAKRLTEPFVPVLAIIQKIYPYGEPRHTRKLEVRFMESEGFSFDDPLNFNLYDVVIKIPVGNLFIRIEEIISLRK